MLLDEICPETIQATITVKVIDILISIESYHEGKCIKVSSVLIGDKTAIGILEIIGDVQLSTNDIIELRNIYARISFGFLRIRSSPFSAKTVETKEAFPVNFGLNISEIEYSLAS